MIAQASGQIQLSVELTSRLAFPQIKAQTLNAMNA
jgi:hypothetical protein